MTLTCTDPRPGAPVEPSSGALRPLPFGALRLTDGYWAEWQRLNATVILQHCEDWMERIGWIGNFDAAAAGHPFRHAGLTFADSEIYKLLEAMAWELGRSDDADLASRYEALVSRVAAAQDSDGYLHTSFGREGQPARWSDLEWGHELYCAGHLLQAAVARLRTRGSGRIVDLARRFADLLVKTFGERGREAICGHPEIETALAEFGRATGDDRYLRLAQLFIKRRGHGLLSPIEFGSEYFQDDMPVRSATVLRGHAVRAVYLACGAVDVGVETGDDGLVTAVERQWAATAARRTYLTGAIGAHHQDEAFGADWELPPDREYGETCAAIGSNMLSWRLLLRTGESKYADLIERTLFNAVMVSPRSDGRAFFYANTMHQRTRGTSPPEDQVSPRAHSSLRAPWFEVSCCPTNVARTLASVESTFATMTERGLQLHQYGSYDIDVTLPGGEEISLEVRSEWPNIGRVELTTIRPSRGPVELRLRIPSWADRAEIITRDGARVVPAEAGSVTIDQVLIAGDRIVLDIPLSARWTEPDPRIDAVRGTVAVERGPIVYALESHEADLDDVVVDRLEPPVFVDGSVSVSIRRRLFEGRVDGIPYGAPAAMVGEPSAAHLVPYSAWGNHGPSTMRVWLPTS